MKKLLALLLALTMLFCLCACGGNTAPQTTEATQQTTEATEPENPFKNVDETKPNKRGVYEICSAQGLLNIANHPDGSFELLCDIDLGGAVWNPVGTQDAPFTGTLNGKKFTVSNFKIQASTSDGHMGFLGVNAGTVKNLYLKDMTVIADAATAWLGGLAGSNTGTIQNCQVYGTVTVAAAAENAGVGGLVGKNTGALKSSEVEINLDHSASGDAHIGGIAGQMTGGSASYIMAGTTMKIAGQNKTVGLLAGSASDLHFDTCIFLGSASRLNETEFRNYIGQEQNVTMADCMRRDNSREELDPQLRALREKAVQAMYDMGTIFWTVSEPLICKCKVGYCSGGGCTTSFAPGNLYRGLPYRHNTGSLDRILYCLDENNVIEDWVYTLEQQGGVASYMGSDCLRSVQMAWATVANSMNTPSCMSFIDFGWEVGAIVVGDLPQWTEETADRSSAEVIEMVGEEKLFDAYAQMRAGDAVVRVDKDGAGHGMMVAIDPVIVRSDDGKINPVYSYVRIHEQGNNEDTTEFFSSWSINRKVTFEALCEETFLPFTIEEFINGEQETPTAKLVGGVEGRLGLTTGIVESNFYIDSVSMEITDSQGTVVFQQKMFTRMDLIKDYVEHDMFERMLTKTYDLAFFANGLLDVEFLADETYHCIITANLHTFDKIVVKDYTF